MAIASCSGSTSSSSKVHQFIMGHNINHEPTVLTFFLIIGDALALAAATKNIQQVIERRGSSSTSGFSWSTSTTEDNPSSFFDKLKPN
jgi:hypothetical protein